MTRDEWDASKQHTFAIQAEDVPVVHHVLIHIVFEGEKLLLGVPIPQGVEDHAHDPRPGVALGEDDGGASCT